MIQYRWNLHLNRDSRIRVVSCSGLINIRCFHPFTVKSYREKFKIAQNLLRNLIIIWRSLSTANIIFPRYTVYLDHFFYTFAHLNSRNFLATSILCKIEPSNFPDKHWKFDRLHVVIEAQERKEKKKKTSRCACLVT